MILNWFKKKPELRVEVLGTEIVVTMPGSSCRIVYTKTEDNKLVVSTFRAAKVPERISFSQFLALAGAAANATAKEIGWIPFGRA